MQGLMQDWPLLVHKIIDYAARWHGEREIVTRSIEGPIRRTNWACVRTRALTLARALTKLGVKTGDRIGTLAWNTDRHLECWYAIMGMGAVCHTLNPRLFPEQIAWIASHAEDRIIFADVTFAPILKAVAGRIPSLERVVWLCEAGDAPALEGVETMAYEDLIKSADDDFEWPALDENTACGLCYTSGTTGNPKGVVYTHRSTIIHTLAANSADGFGIRSLDSVLPVVPMFHANAWAIAYIAPAAGAKLVMPGAKLDGPSVYELLEQEKVTVTAAVPTVWLMLLQHMEAHDLKLSTLKRVAIGGSACPPAMIETFEQKYGVEVIHAWGMTEMSPLGTLGAFKAGMEELPWPERLRIKSKQGRALFTVEMKIEDDEGRTLPHDGRAFGHLMVRGPAIAKAYMKGEGGRHGSDLIVDQDGWFDTGDVATIDPLGFMQITDRAKDVIKSGGEWISSIEIENLAVGAPGVAEAAVIGVSHPKWDERPLLVIVPKKDAKPDKAAILAYLEGRIAKWWMPDDVVFVDEIPHTATGKIQKIALREQFKDHRLPAA